MTPLSLLLPRPLVFIPSPLYSTSYLNYKLLLAHLTIPSSLNTEFSQDYFLAFYSFSSVLSAEVISSAPIAQIRAEQVLPGSEVVIGGERVGVGHRGQK
jgi:hypothetical protein